MEFETISYNRQLTQKLVEAVLDKNHAEIEELFNKETKPDVNAEFNGIPLIIYAAQKKDWKSLIILYNNDVNLDCKTEPAKWTLMHECVVGAPDNVFNAIIQYCDLNQQDKNGKTPLMVAIEESRFDRAEALLNQEQGLNVSLIDKSHENAGHYAAKQKAYDILLKLGERKLPFNQLNKNNESVLDLIEDISFKENLPKMINKLIHVEQSVTNPTSEVVEEDKSVEVASVEKPKKIGGLSSIKRK